MERKRKSARRLRRLSAAKQNPGLRFAPSGLRATDEALKEIGGRTQSVNAQTGVYNVTVQARGNGQTIIFKISHDGTLGTVTYGGYGGDELGKISDSETTKRFRDLLVGAVKKAAS
jgi:hypothetical protein